MNLREVYCSECYCKDIRVLGFSKEKGLVTKCLSCGCEVAFACIIIDAEALE